MGWINSQSYPLAAAEMHGLSPCRSPVATHELTQPSTKNCKIAVYVKMFSTCEVNKQFFLVCGLLVSVLADVGRCSLLRLSLIAIVAMCKNKPACHYFMM